MTTMSDQDVKGHSTIIIIMDQPFCKMSPLFKLNQSNQISLLGERGRGGKGMRYQLPMNLYTLAYTSTMQIIPVPRRKGTRIHAVQYRKYVDFTRNFARITARYRPKPFISGAIEYKRQKGALRSCARSNLRLLSFNVPEYRTLPAYFNVETPALLNLELFVTVRFGMPGRRTVIISCTTARYRVVPTNARANRAFTRSFSPGYHLARISEVNKRMRLLLSVVKKCVLNRE